MFSEAPKSVASKRLLLLNMPLLAEQRVEVLYIEHLLTDKHLRKLARYRQLGKKVAPALMNSSITCKRPIAAP